MANSQGHGDEWTRSMLARVEALVHRTRLTADPGDPNGGQSSQDDGAVVSEEEELARLEAEQEVAWKEEKAKQDAALNSKYTADKLAADKARKEISPQAVRECGIQPEDDALGSLDSLGLDLPPQMQKTSDQITIPRRRDFFSSLSYAPELIMELATHLRIQDLVSLYSISKDFNAIINGHLSHCMKACSYRQAFESSQIFRINFYEPLSIPDPVGRLHPKNPNAVRNVASLRWLQMVVHREKTVRDILACMARQGHRMPPGTSKSLKKMWLTMDISTTARRVQMVHNEKFWTDKDLFNIQLFIVKLDMRFNDPIEGSGDETMRKLMLGQRGLTPLCKALKRTAFTSKVEVIKAAIRYAYKTRPEHENMPIFDIPPAEIGIGHLEGWGKGQAHLCRVDELVPREAVRRRLRMEDWIMHMMLYGYVDPITGENTPPTDEEKYMSDDEGPEGEVGSRIIKWGKFPVETYKDDEGNTIMTG